jgi:signal transduction histidine kinase
MGRFLRDGLIDKISRLTDVSFDVKNLFKHSLNTDYGSMLLLESPPNTIFQPDGDKITATKVYKDISGVPMMELSVTENREILLHGYEALRVAQLYTIGGVMASLLLMMLMLHRSLVRPLLDITHKISSSQGPGQSWTKLDMGSCASYEMCVLADEFNNLMEALDAKNTKIIETNHKLRDEASKLAEAEKNLKNLDNLKSEFISTAAHELRTPVATIMGYTELLSDESLNQSFSEEQKKDFRKEIMDNSERLSMIIDDILDLSRIEHGQSILLDKTYASLEEILKKSSRLLAIKSEAVISINISPEVPKEIEIDAHRISQVVDNLLSNAIKYSPERRSIFVNVELEGEHCKVAIIDQGIGMNEEQRTQIFDKFYRADATNTAVRGLGLGMSIVKRIINEHGGTIWVESAIGQGTKVHFTLPLGARGKVVSVNLK